MLKIDVVSILSIILVAALCMQDASYIVYADENPPEELSCEVQAGIAFMHR